MQLAESKATPIFDSLWVRVHPAVGLIGGNITYYFGITYQPMWKGRMLTEAARRGRYISS